MRLFSICLSLCDLSQHNALRGLSLLSQMTGFPFSLSLFWPYHMAGRILVLQPGIEPGPRSESAEPEALDHQRIPTDALFLRLNNTPWHITCVCVCVCVRVCDPLICWWAQVVSVCCEACCSQHEGADIFSRWRSSFCWANTQKWNCWVTEWPTFNFLRSFCNVFHSDCTDLQSSPIVLTCPLSPHPQQRLWFPAALFTPV